MAYNLPTNPSVGDTTSANGTTLVCIAVDPDQWAPVQWGGPGTVITELSDGVSFTPPEGAISHQVILWPPGDDEAQIKQYTPLEMGASATVNIGTEADGTDSTFNPAGTGATLTATAGTRKRIDVLSEGNLNAASSLEIDVTGWTAYDVIGIDMANAGDSSGGIKCTFSIDGGSTFKTGSSDYSRVRYEMDASAFDYNVSSATTHLYLENWDYNASGTPGTAVNFQSRWEFHNLHNTTNCVMVQLHCWNNYTEPFGYMGYGAFDGFCDDVTDIRLVSNGGGATLYGDYVIWGQRFNI